ncbi:MAG: toxin-antitoxin system YwqK family antitoxin [Chitinophagales bacterium]|nr:toxin-antitoxin system YwqK family antitoxin [Chitinophagales bacterium]
MKIKTRMMNNILIAILICSTTIIHAQQDTVFTKIDSDRNLIAFETTNKDLSIDKGTIKDGKLHGNLLHYFPNGVLMGMKQYRHGVQDGVQLYFDKTGLLSKQENYINDTLNGEMRTYTTSNNVRILQQSQYYKNGKLDGLAIEYNNMGKTSSAEEYKAGIKNGRSIWYYNNGEPAMEQFYVNGILEGTQTVYNMNGVVISQGKNKNGAKSGMWLEYFDNGKVKSEGNYTEDNKTGKWKYYDESGKLINEENL